MKIDIEIVLGMMLAAPFGRVAICNLLFLKKKGAS
jgi:hypothetical protein